MTNRILIVIFIAAILTSCQTESQTPIIYQIHDNWKFKSTKEIRWHSASVPGDVHSDLLHHNLIKNPFIGENEHDLQWISETDWEYKTTFSLDQYILDKKHIDLNFEGLDTYATIYLNDTIITKTNNAFVNWKKNVKSLLKLKNTLRVVFSRPSKLEATAKAKLAYQLPGGNRIFTRKAQFQYGWDWGPKLNTMGIWRPVTLTAWDDYKINNLNIKQTKLSNSSANLIIDLHKTSNALLDKKLNYDIYVNDTLHTSSKRTSTDYTWETQIQIKNPKLWWPHNLGHPYLYDIKVVVKDGKTVLDSISKKIGLRTIELVHKKDSIGTSFYFKVNDVPVYAKGANYIPQHSFQSQVSTQHYKNLIHNVVDANMNMLRVWGGGIYEAPIFYDLCDEKGILVWQDFMFACAMYPGDKDFLENVQNEATYNVKRLRNHPSIALWCGNNENNEGWHRWGWQANRTPKEKKEIWHNYLKVFDSILPKTVHQLTDVAYWESSPKYGRGNPNYEFEGDAHDWWIWHDAYPFEHLETHVPRFMSEFGMQALPSYETVKYINQSDSLDLSSKGFKNHQKHHRGFELIDIYMERDFPKPKKAEDYIYMSQLVQSYGITMGIEAHRRAKPRNMGTLYWQLNDCWPSVSWSSIDYFGNWKALHYKAKQSFENLLISSNIKSNTIKTFAVNDHLTPYNLHLKFELLDFNGNRIWSDSISASVDSNTSQLIFKKNLDDFKFDRTNAFLKISSKNQQWLKYFSKPKALKLKQETLKTSIRQTNEGFEIELSSNTLQKNVFLYTDAKGHFSNNFFDLLPNEVKTITFETEASTLADLKIKTLNDFIDTTK
ncbi:MAG: glycoside hydrolase family 2 protein [Flavobacteriaceae bacterium]|nr:glycoside hydrolase family 2 protein [Flavobacteriaceae bacterium]